MLRVATQLAMRGALRTYIRLDAVGRENLPLDRSFVMVCNHSSHLDAVCLLSTLPLTRIHTAFPVAAADYFFSTSLRSILSTVAVNGLPLDRQNGTDGLRVCRPTADDSKTVLIIFPEGTRTCTGTLGRFRSGVARLVAGTDVPVVPCYLSGAFEVWPKGQIPAATRGAPTHHRSSSNVQGCLSARPRWRSRQPVHCCATPSFPLPFLSRGALWAP
jgi:1-acyl-sn-glycerol-3-phosphate acyltransferase